MGKGLQKVAALCGGLTVEANGQRVEYNASGQAVTHTAQAPVRGVMIYRQALLDMLGACMRAGQSVEEGGILVGYQEPTSGMVTIAYAIDGGPNAEREPRKVVRDVEYSQAALNQLYAQSGGRLDYIGEWHRHHSRIADLSPTDVAALRAVAEDPGYPTSYPLFVVLSLPNIDDITGRQLRFWTLGDDDQVVEIYDEVAVINEPFLLAATL